jgi:toxin ParE1/3/4
MILSVHPAAERDVWEAAAFYEREGSPALAARFVKEFRRLCESLLEHPEIGSTRSGGKRGLSMSDFPYTVIYRVLADELRILVVKHDRRRPGYGSTRT